MSQEDAGDDFDGNVDESLRGLADSVIQAKHLECKRVMEQVGNQLLEVAATLSDDGDKTKVEALRGQYMQLLQLAHEMEQHKEALDRDVLDSYQAPRDKQTDFGKLMDKAVKKRVAAARYDVARDPQLRKFDREVGWAGGDDSDGDEDVVVERDSHLLNAHCPISLKKVLELVDPVEDEQGYVYERQAIQEHVRAAGGKARCPVAGTTHWITAGGFRPSVRVKRERRRMLMAAATQVAAGGAAAGNTQGGGGGGGAGGRRDVFDADELASQLA